MTPREVDELTADEYAAFWRWLEADMRQRDADARRIERQSRRRR